MTEQEKAAIIRIADSAASAGRYEGVNFVLRLIKELPGDYTELLDSIKKNVGAFNKK